jgi:phenylacetic acid degradation protein paaN
LTNRPVNYVERRAQVNGIVGDGSGRRRPDQKQPGGRRPRAVPTARPPSAASRPGGKIVPGGLMTRSTAASEFHAAHRATLEAALSAAGTRGYWTAYPESPSPRIYGEAAKAEGTAAFEALLDTPFELDQPTTGGRVGAEVSPYGRALGVTYPAADPDALVAAAKVAGKGWAAASIEDRAGVALEILARLNKQSFLIAEAVSHTTGQSFIMAFQAGGPHAQDRGLEAVAYAVAEMRRVPAQVRWEKPAGKGTVVLDKEFRLVPRGVGLVIGCATFPTWNGYPGLFASLVTGNAVIVKPHPGAILPLAITVKIARDVLKEAGFDPNVVTLAADTAEAPLTKALATHPGVGIVDFTGSPAFGRWLRENVRQALVYTEEAGVNPVVIDGTASFKGMCQNLAFSLSLYSGQMCTAPQNLFVPASGIETDEGHKSFDEVAAGIAKAVDGLLSDADRAAGVLGAVQNPATLERIAAARTLGAVVRDSAPVDAPALANARTATPLILAVDASDEDAYLEERFGPIAFVVKTKDTADSIARAAHSAKSRGAITAAVYSTDGAVLGTAEDAFADAGVALSENLTGGIFVNQSAAFSDFHVTGANPAGNACLTDSAFVAGRFRVVGIRTPAAA